MAAVTYIAQDFKRFAASRKQVIDMQVSSFGDYYRVCLVNFWQMIII